MERDKFKDLKVGDCVYVKSKEELMEEGWDATLFNAYMFNCASGSCIVAKMYPALGKVLKIVGKSSCGGQALILEGYEGYAWTYDMVDEINTTDNTKMTKYRVLYKTHCDKEILFTGELIGGDMYSFTKEATWVFLEEDDSYRIIPFSSIIYMEKL